MDALCIGLCVVDALGRPVDSFPEKGKLTVFDEMQMHIGGCAAATAVALARTGVKTALAGRIGSDGLGDLFINSVKSSGVDVSCVARDNTASTAFTFVAVSSDGDRTFFHCPGADDLLSINDLNMDVLKNARVVHLGGSLVMKTLDGEQSVEILKTAKRSGATTSIDTAYNSSSNPQNAFDVLPITDFFFTGYDEGVYITGETDYRKIASRLKENGCGTAIVKLGGKGSYILTADNSMMIEPYPAEVVDTCGAGDVYVAGFLSGLLQGWNTEKCGRLGALLASYSIRAMGGTTGIPDERNISAFERLL